ncbi:hypothetical protein VB620_02290 [Nodularia harveyana UHCC-0300]|uniref:Uncharacterized protein n=1 Tax=Nodularia harveyana UHCC-0300 TaxID=2974287 RepID=A0ABU5U9I5_9CYAN|nr:hypothetical protein [Nodularia harveyana]MEA5580167.1 hypothetical protein [Nodularia harveyana UHCC-0300]
MNNLRKRLYGKQLKNSKIYREFQDIGFDYILNPDTQELHLVGSDKFLGSHNLVLSNLEDFIGLVNIGVLEIHKLRDGFSVPVYDLETGDLIAEYAINKCLHCFP